VELKLLLHRRREQKFSIGTNVKFCYNGNFFRICYLNLLHPTGPLEQIVPLEQILEFIQLDPIVVLEQIVSSEQILEFAQLDPILLLHPSGKKKK
jgi:hypothetical protein